MFQNRWMCCAGIGFVLLAGSSIGMASEQPRRESHDEHISYLHLDLSSEVQLEDVLEYLESPLTDMMQIKGISEDLLPALQEALSYCYDYVVLVPQLNENMLFASKYPHYAWIDEDDLNKETCLEVMMQQPVTYVIRSSLHRRRQYEPKQPVALQPVVLGVWMQMNPYDQKSREEYVFIKNQGGGSQESGGGYVGGRIDIKIGPDIDWSASIQGGYEDQRGNYAEIEVEHNNKGETNIGIEAGHEKK